MQAAVLVAGQVDHPGHRLVGAGDLEWPPDVLVDAEGRDAVEPVGLGQPPVCASASIASQQVCQSTPRCRASADTVVSSCAQRVDRPPRSPGRSAWPGAWQLVDLGEGPTGTRRFGQRQIRLRHRTRTGRAEARSVVQQLDSAAVADRDHPPVRDSQ